jgi:hypothetical protein
MTTTKRWQDWVNLVLGSWLFVSPWALQYTDTTAAMNAHVMGAGIVAFAAIAAYMPRAWEEVINTLLGVWLVLSPFILAFTGMSTIALHTVVIGVLVTGFAVWAMFSDRAFYERWHGGHSV